MVALSPLGRFRCVVLTPTGKLLDCRAASLILPGHDGQLGILRNHAPMLCELGTGIMEVRNIVGGKDAFYLIEGGFTRISENFVTVLAYDVTTFEGMDKEQAQKLVSRAQSVLVGGRYVRQMDDMEVERAAMLVKMGKLSNTSTEE